MIMIPYNIPYFVCRKKGQEHVYKVWLYPLVLHTKQALPNADFDNATAKGLFHPEYNTEHVSTSSEWYCFHVSNNFLTFEFKESRGQLLRDVLTRSFYQNGGTIFLQHVLGITSDNLSRHSKGYPINLRHLSVDGTSIEFDPIGKNCCNHIDECTVEIGKHIRVLLQSAHTAFARYFNSWQLNKSDHEQLKVAEKLKAKYKHVDTESRNTFLETLKKCSFKDVISRSPDITKLIETIIQHRRTLSNKLILTDKIYRFRGLNHIDDECIQTLTQIMILNQLLGDVYTLQSLCNDIDNRTTKDKINQQNKCKDIYKLRLLEHTFDVKNLVYGKTRIVNGFKGTRAEFIFQIMFGNLIRKSQWQKYTEIIAPSTRTNVYQFLMGKGKSSVITPLLMLHFMNTQHAIPLIYLIVPMQLFVQAKHDLFQFSMFFRAEEKFKIQTDAQIKESFMNHGEGQFRNSVFIIDEFDSLYDPVQSNFNVVETMDALQSVFTDEQVSYVVGNVIQTAKVDSGDSITKETCDDPIFRLYTEVILDGVPQLKANQHYGMSKQCDTDRNDIKDKWNSRIAIPYLRKDTPLEGSSFSSEIISLALTVQYKVRNGRIQFEPEDILYMVFKFETDEDQDALMCFVNKPETKSALRDLSAKLDGEYHIKADIGNTYRPLMEEVADCINNGDSLLKYDLLKRFMCVVNEFKIKTAILNCSFIDIIGMHNIRFQTGFTGTVNIEMINYPPRTGCNNFSGNIIEDHDEKLGVYTAFTGLVDQNKVICIDSGTDIYTHIDNEYHMLIDAAGVLINDSNLSIVQAIAKKNPSREYVYLDNDDNKKVYARGIVTDYTGHVQDDAFYYYSQKNIIGVDFRQPTNMRGLLIVDKSLSYTNMAQAIYRARKLNGGHIMDIMYHRLSTEPPAYKPSQEELYECMVNNDKRLKQDRQDLLHSQVLKYMVRSELIYSGSSYRHDKSFYRETDTKPVFITVGTKAAKTVANNTTLRIKELSSKFGKIIEHYEVLKDDSLLTQLRHDIKGKTEMLSVIKRIETLCSSSHYKFVQEICTKYRAMLEAVHTCTNVLAVDCDTVKSKLFHSNEQPFFDNIITPGEFNKNFLDMYDHNSTYAEWKNKKPNGEPSTKTFIEETHKRLHTPFIAKQLCLGLSGGLNTERQQQQQMQQQQQRQTNRHLQSTQERGIPLKQFRNYFIPHQTFYDMSDKDLHHETFVLDEDDHNILAVSYSIFDESWGKHVSLQRLADKDGVPTYIKLDNIPENPELMGVYEKIPKRTNNRCMWKQTGTNIASDDDDTYYLIHDGNDTWVIITLRDARNYTYKQYKTFCDARVKSHAQTPIAEPWEVWKDHGWKESQMKVSEYTLLDEQMDIERSKYLTSDARVLRLKKDGHLKTWWIITKRTCGQYMLRLDLQLTLQKRMCNNHLLNITELPKIPACVLPIFGDFNRNRPPNKQTAMILSYLTKKYDLVSNQYEYTQETYDFIKAKLDERRRSFNSFKSNYRRNCTNYPYLEVEHGFAAEDITTNMTRQQFTHAWASRTKPVHDHKKQSTTLHGKASEYPPWINVGYIADMYKTYPKVTKIEVKTHSDKTSIRFTYANNKSHIEDIEYTYITTDTNSQAFSKLRGIGCKCHTFEDIKEYFDNQRDNLNKFLTIVEGDVTENQLPIFESKHPDVTHVVLNASQTNYLEQKGPRHDPRTDLAGFYDDPTFGPGVVRSQTGGGEFLAYTCPMDGYGATQAFFDSDTQNPITMQIKGGYYKSSSPQKEHDKLAKRFCTSDTKIEGFRWKKTKQTPHITYVYQTGAINSASTPNIYQARYTNGKPTPLFEFGVIFTQFRNAMLHESKDTQVVFHTTRLGEGVFGNSENVSLYALLAAYASLPPNNQRNIVGISVGGYKLKECVAMKSFFGLPTMYKS